MQLGGVSIWSLDMDDFMGAFCNLGPFPIIEAIKEEFEHKVCETLNVYLILKENLLVKKW